MGETGSYSERLCSSYGYSKCWSVLGLCDSYRAYRLRCSVCGETAQRVTLVAQCTGDLSLGLCKPCYVVSVPGHFDS